MRIPSILLLAIVVFAMPNGAIAQIRAGLDSQKSGYDFETSVSRLEAAIAEKGLYLIATASASRAARAQGIEIPGNAVLLVFRNDYARRMLATSIDAGIEAPLRFYVTDKPGIGVTIAWQVPSSVFAPYENSELNTIARELDPIFASIVAAAVSAK
jgi:uncharacterized protein (DUF302 family)